LKEILNIAHRGASAYAHENTFDSIQKAIELGADMVEFDLRRTADDVIVLWHDEHVRDRKGKWVPVSNIPVSYLNILSKKNGFELVRFDDVLREFGSRIALNIEIKTSGFEEEVVYQLKKHTPLFPPMVSSFHPKVIRKIKKLDCSLKTGLVVGNSRLLKFGYFSRAILRQFALKSRADSVHLNLNIALDSIINELTDLGFDIYIWTVNDKRNMRNLIDMGVDGIITDKPDTLNSIKDALVEGEPSFSKEEVG